MAVTKGAVRSVGESEARRAPCCASGLDCLALSRRCQNPRLLVTLQKRNGRQSPDEFVLLALRALCASADCSGAYFLMSFNAGNNNDPENFDHIAIAWVVGAVVSSIR